MSPGIPVTLFYQVRMLRGDEAFTVVYAQVRLQFETLCLAFEILPRYNPSQLRSGSSSTLLIPEIQ